MKTEPQNLPFIKEWETSKLQAVFQEITETIATQKGQLDAIGAELLRRYASTFEEEMKAGNQIAGEVTRHVDGIKMTYAVKPKVKWDSQVLQDLAKQMDDEIAARIFKVEYSVPEKTYKAITDKLLLSAITKARTVEYSDPKITFAR